MKEKHILIVDDEVKILRSINMSLGLNGYKVTDAKNGREAIEKIISFQGSSEKIDMMVTDIQMPEMSGIELIDELEKRKITLPTLVITGFGTKEMVIQLLQRGVKDYLDKPFNPKKLMARIERFFAKVKNANDEPTGKETRIDKPFELMFEDGWEIFLSNCEYSADLQEELRTTLLKILDNVYEMVRFDLKLFPDVDITFLNALTGFAEAHKQKYPEGKLEIINVNKDIYILFNAVDLTELYTISLLKE